MVSIAERLAGHVATAATFGQVPATRVAPAPAAPLDSAGRQGGVRRRADLASNRARRALAVATATLLVGATGGVFGTSLPAAAVHDTDTFELDGNAIDDLAIDGADWSTLQQPGQDVAVATTFVSDGIGDETNFFQGGSKDDLPISGWKWSTIDGTPDKDDIVNVYASAFFNESEELNLYFGADRYANNGTATLGFWFLQQAVAPIEGGTFSGEHEVGDLLVVADFTNGGDVSTVKLYRWVGSGGSHDALHLVATQEGSSGNCLSAPVGDSICATTNGADVDAPWGYTPKSGPEGVFPPNSFFEGGVNVDALGVRPRCISTYIAETRTSVQPNARLKDFALGALETCREPEIATTSSPGGNVEPGTLVRDTATFALDELTVTGTAEFFLCQPGEVTAAGCSTGGMKVGSTKTVNGGTATSDSIAAPTTAGRYCWRVEYAPPSETNKFLAASHTNPTSECFTVVGPPPPPPPALSVTVDKTNNADGVGGYRDSEQAPAAGADVPFRAVITNTSTVAVVISALTDVYPGRTAFAVCPDLVGDTVAAGASVICDFTVADYAPPAGDDLVDTVAVTVTLPGDPTNTASDTDDSTVTTPPPPPPSAPTIDLVVVKSDSPDPITLGTGNLTYTLTVTNNGPSRATGVFVTDTLPESMTFVSATASQGGACTISGREITCPIGSLADDATATVTVVVTPTRAGRFTNVVVVDGNETETDTTNNRDDEPTLVRFVDLALDKTDNGAIFTAGSTGTYTITVTNVGDAPTTGPVSVTDSLPAGLTFVSEASADWSCTTTTGQLVNCLYGGGVLQPGATAAPIVLTVAIASGVVGPVINTATVDTPNDENPANDTDTEPTDLVAVLGAQLNRLPADAPPTVPAPEARAPKVGGARIARTGAATTATVWIAAALVSFGGLLVIPDRRRRRRS